VKFQVQTFEKSLKKEELKKKSINKIESDGKV
jgi:hypothetical protein